MSVGKIKVPPEVREAVAKAAYEHWNAVMNSGPPWEEVDDNWREGMLGQADAAIAALFASWPGAVPQGYYTANGPRDCLILPLPQEASDE